MHSTITYDARFALRGFTRDRRFTLSALAAIALAVGGATAVFSVVDRSLFRPLPYHQGDRLVSVGVVAPILRSEEFFFAGTYREWRSSQTVLEGLTSWSGVSGCDLGDDSPQRLDCARVEATFLPMLGVEPILGRNFTADEDRQGADAVTLLSFGLWQGRFGADRSILERSITVDGTPTRIIGVLPPNFETPTLTPADLLMPQKMRMGPHTENYMVSVIGRLRPGRPAASSAAALEPLFQRFWEGLPADLRNAAGRMQLRVETLRDRQTREYRLALWMLLGSVIAIVLIACANVANLLLARSAMRQQEFAVRTALGASRWRLAQQMLTESGLLGLLGGSAGCALAFWLLRVFIALAPDGTLRLREAALDLRVLGFTLFLSLGSALVFGLAPALDRMRVRRAGPRRTWVRQVLITAQLSVSLMLLMGAGLLLLSLWRLENAPLGFTSERIVTASFTLPQYRYADEIRQLNFFNQLEARLNELPGAVAAAITDTLPPGGDTRTLPYVALANPGGNAAEPGMSGSVRWRYVTPGYFEALGIPIKRGRGFNGEDRQPGAQPLILSESLARRLFGLEDPIGRRLRSQVVVGVAGDARNTGLSGVPDPEMYSVRKIVRNEGAGSSDPNWPRHATVIVRSSLDEHIATESLRAAIQQLDPAVPVVLETMDSHVQRFFTRPRFQTFLLSMFAATGLLLAAIGLYGLISFLVAERTREIGVRMALGATPSRIAKLVVSDGVRWTAAGVIAGTAAATGLLRLLEGLLYQVKANDLRVFGGAIALLAGVAILAAWLPGRRASRIDPMAALRHD